MEGQQAKDYRCRLKPVLVDRAREMRRRPSTAEQKLWHRLRDRRLGGFKFRRQCAIGPFVVDFYCAEAELVVETDGDSHGGEEPEKYDSERTRWLERQGLRVARYWNHEVLENLDGVAADVLRICEGGSVDS